MQNRLSAKSLQNRESILCFWFAFSFILNGYASGLPGLSLGSVVFVALVLYSIIHSQHCKIFLTPIILLFLFAIISIIDYSITPNSIDISSVSMGLSKYLIWAFMITYCSSIIFKKEQLLKWMVRFSFVLLIYLIVQNISFYIFSRFLPNIIEFGPFHAYDSGYASEEFGENFIIRPASLLSESSFLGNFFTATLIMLLVENYKDYSKWSFRLSLVFSLGIILTSSTSAIIQLPVIWLLLGKNCYKNNKLTSTVFIALIAYGLISLFAIFSTLGDSNNALVYSVFYAFNKFDNIENSTRFGNSYAFLNYMPDYLKALGVGIGNEVAFLKNYVSSEHYYMNSVTQMLVQIGWGGFALFVTYLLTLIRKSIMYKERGVLLLVGLYFAHGFGSGMWLGTYGVLFLFIANGYLISAYRERINLKHKNHVVLTEHNNTNKE